MINSPSHFIQEVKGGGTAVGRDQHLVFGVRRVDAPPVSAGPQQDVNGVELQEDFTGHAVKEGDVRQRCRGQQKHFAAGRALTQTCRHNVSAGRLTGVWWIQATASK